ncbi:MAG: c-type cytochrome [Myxococcales bacterium]|nr:c-type cytochrome [Myxococcales bacterium]MCB9750965.1 c-type cytochrome [Myxococcales bacterium]
MAATALLATGCQDTIDLDPLDDSPVVESRVRPAPIIGGTLVVTSDGLAVAADPDRDLLHIVDIDARDELHAVALEPGDQPGRVALGSDGRAHVVLRGAGALATVELTSGEVLARHPVCPEPRGVAFDSGDASLYVACAGGDLVHLSEAGDELKRVTLEPDLRDVIFVNGEVMVSRFRSAELLGLDGSRISIPNQGPFEAHVAWRTWVNASGDIEILHQMHDTQDVPIDPDPDDTRPGDGAYGGGGFCETGIVNAAVSTITTTDDGPVVNTVMMLDSQLTVDASPHPDGDLLAMAVPGAAPRDVADFFGDDFGRSSDESFMVSPKTYRVEFRGGSDCGFFEDNPEPEPEQGQVVAVAHDSSGALIMQSREPARLLILDAPQPFETRDAQIVELAGEARLDTGHEIFHRSTESNLSCASCHPEGGDDGHTWRFTEIGKRRTQPLDVGLEDTAPFHWDGDMDDLDMIMGEILAHRMGGKRQSEPRRDSFERWVFAQQRPPADDGRNDALLVSRGEALFASYDCTRCHYGAALGGTTTELIRGEQKQVPTLRRVALHPPYMHDGRSPTLEHAVQDMIESTRQTTAPQDDVDAITAYLRTL